MWLQCNRFTWGIAANIFDIIQKLIHVNFSISINSLEGPCYSSHHLKTPNATCIPLHGKDNSMNLLVHTTVQRNCQRTISCTANPLQSSGSSWSWLAIFRTVTVLSFGNLRMSVFPSLKNILVVIHSRMYYLG